MVIALCGYMGSGKTTLGKVLAKKLSCDFADTDDYIESTHNQSIPEIFKLHGEEYFRELEYNAIKHFANSNKIVLSLGGGLPIKDKNKEVLKKMFVVYIKSDFENCYSRIKNPDRPIVKNNTKSQLNEHYNNRIPHYEKVADLVVDGEDIEEMAEQVEKFVKEKI